MRPFAARGEGPLFLDLWHPSVEGHRVADEAIAADLEPLYLVP